MRKVITVIFIMASGFAFGQTNTELNGLIHQSFTYFPHLQEMAKTEELNELRVAVAETSNKPNVSAIGSYSYVNPISQVALPLPGFPEKLLFQPHNNYNTALNVNQVLWDFGRIRAQIEKAKADLLVSHQATEATRLQVAAQVATIYYAMVFLKRSVEVQDSIIAYYVQDRKIIEGKLKEGDALKIDLSTIENNIDQEKNRKIEFERQYNRQAALLRYTTGQTTNPGGNDFDFQYSPGVSDLNSNPDVLAAIERINSAQADIRLSSSNKLPSLSLQAAAGWKNGYQPDLYAFRFNYLAGATLNIPIYQAGRLRQSESIARKSAELSEIAKTNTITTLQKDVESAQSDVNAYNEQIKNSEGQIDVATETQRLTQVRYKQGVATYLDLVSASTDLQRAYLTRLQYEYQKTLAQVELCRLSGVKFWQE